MQVLKRDAGADRPIVVTKSGNSDGAKGANHSAERSGQPMREEPRRSGKPYEIPKQSVWEAYKRVRANGGAAGVDGQSLAAFEVNLKDNLYKVWNRMSSGSYFPSRVRRVEIPKQSGGTRPLGIPTVTDRIAQSVVKELLEREVEPIFHPSSFGARRNLTLARDYNVFCSNRLSVCDESPNILDKFQLPRTDLIMLK